MLEAILAIAAIIIIFEFIRRGRRSHEKEAAEKKPAKPTVGELLNRQDVPILDTETTGLGISDEVVEIVIIDTTGAVRLSTVVLPKGRISRRASDIHGLALQALRDLDAENWRTYHGEVRTLLQSAQVVIGWNVSFDTRILKQTAEKYYLSTPKLNTIEMLEFYRRVRKRKRNKLSDAIKAEGLARTGQSHRAKADCRAGLAIMNKLVDE